MHASPSPDPSEVLRNLPAVPLLVATALTFLLAGATAQSLDLAYGVWLTELWVFLVPPLLLARAYNLKPTALFGLRTPLPAGLLLQVLLLSAVNYAFAGGLMGVLDLLLPDALHWMDVDALLGQETGLRFALLTVGVAGLAPLGEEVLFRGLLQPHLCARLGTGRGLVVTAALFSLLHLDPIGLVPRFELGLLFGWLVLRTGSLWASILAHAVNNGAALLLWWAAGHGAPAAPLEAATLDQLPALLTVLGIGGLLLVPLLRSFARQTAPLTGRQGPRVEPLRPGAPVAFDPREGLRSGAAAAGLLALFTAGWFWVFPGPRPTARRGVSPEAASRTAPAPRPPGRTEDPAAEPERALPGTSDGSGPR